MHIDQAHEIEHLSAAYKNSKFRKKYLSTAIALSISLLIASCSDSPTAIDNSSASQGELAPTQPTTGADTDSCQSSSTDSSSGDNSSSSTSSSAETSGDSQCTTSEGETSGAADETVPDSSTQADGELEQLVAEADTMTDPSGSPPDSQGTAPTDSSNSNNSDTTASAAPADTSTSTDVDTGTDASTGSDVDTGTDASTSSDVDTGTDVSTGSDVDTGTDASTGSDVDTDPCETSDHDSSSGVDSSSSSSSSATTSASDECSLNDSSSSNAPAPQSPLASCANDSSIWSTGVFSGTDLSEVCLTRSYAEQLHFSSGTTGENPENSGADPRMPLSDCSDEHTQLAAIAIDFERRESLSLTGVSHGLLTSFNGSLEHTIPLQGDFTFLDVNANTTRLENVLRNDLHRPGFPVADSHYECILSSSTLSVSLNNQSNSLMLSVPIVGQQSIILPAVYDLTGLLIEAGLHASPLNGTLEIFQGASAKYTVEFDGEESEHQLELAVGPNNSLTFTEEKTADPLLQGYYAESAQKLILWHRQPRNTSAPQIVWIAKTNDSE